jgi:hypothetical protein
LVRSIFHNPSQLSTPAPPLPFIIFGGVDF